MFRKLLTLCALLLVLAAPRASAVGIGARAGFSLNPEQVVLGGHLDLISFIPGTRLVIPVELGLGDDFTRFTVAADLAAKLPEISGWGSYLGGELALHNWSSHGNSQTDLGVLLLLGVDKQVKDKAAVGFEVKIGIVDSPDFAALFLYTFGR